MNIYDLTKKLVGSPSFVYRGVDEREIGVFIFKYLQKFPWLSIEKQEIKDGRFNVIAYDKYPTKVMVCDHIDTVQPQSGWNSNPVVPTQRGTKLYGLGTSDSKGNVATLLSAIEKAGPSKGLMVLFYIDEEYDFKGAKEFIKKYKNKIKPRIIASADGSNLELGNACRGLIEINFQVQGQAGHAAVPESGNNAIIGVLKAYECLEKGLVKYKNQDLGKSTINLAYLSGGQKQGNIIPDFAECIIEIRTASEKLNAGKVVKLFEKEIKNQKLKMLSAKIRHDLGSWITKKEILESIEKLLPKVKYTLAENRGYVDLQMFWEEFGKPTCFTYGVGEGQTTHKPNEYIKIANLEKGVKFWTAFFKANCQVQ